MATLHMEGPFCLDNETISKTITRISPGNYLLGFLDDKRFVVKHVGRSDGDIGGRLKSHIGKYPMFKFSYADSPNAAFKKECKNYREFGGDQNKLKNEIHPDRPKGSNWKCQFCIIFEQANFSEY